MASKVQATTLPGPPYPPQIQGLGGTPSILPDIPVNAVFLLLFAATGAAHMTLFKYNQKHGKKFIVNPMTFGKDRR